MQRKLLKTLGATALACSLAACGIDTRTGSIPMPKAYSNLIILGQTPPIFSDVIGSYKTPTENATNDARVAALCGVDSTKAERQFGPLLVFLIGMAIDLVVDLATQAAEDEIQKYTAAYGDTAAFPRYDRNLGLVQNSAFYSSTQPLALSWKCFRLVRGQKSGVASESAKSIDMDLVVQVALAPSGDALLFRPLRVYYGRPAPERIGSDGSVGVAVSASMNAVWKTHVNGAGKSEKVFEQVVFKEKFVAKAPEFAGEVKYYLDEDSTAGLAPVPLVPLSLGAANRNVGHAVLTVQGVEASEPSAMLKWLAKYAKDKKGDIASVLKDAVTKAAGLDK